MFGGDLPSNDDFTLSLLTNEEVLRMHRESTEVTQLFQNEEKVAITSRNSKQKKSIWPYSIFQMIKRWILLLI